MLVVHLGALGAVLRSTALLPALKRKHPHSRLVWLTDAPAQFLLQGNPFIDEVICSKDLQHHPLTALQYSSVYCIDKSLQALRLCQEFQSQRQFGFIEDPVSGGVLPATGAARELWKIGLSDHMKFFENQKTEIQLVHEALELGAYLRENYVLQLSGLEQRESDQRREGWKDASNQILVGLNVGCSTAIPYKKLSVSGHRELVDSISKEFRDDVRVVLLGGREDQDRALEIAKGKDVVVSPMNLGLRDGLCSVNACDLILTGDSLGLHMGVALKKWVVAWFGPTCAHEIDLYDRGVKILSQAPCGPCWKRVCEKELMCYDQVSFDAMIDGIRRGLEWKFSSSKQPSPETCT
ncbi:MAG: heptosyltransferase [Bdellovibrionaceae bacterium]|nr:heptosyltransferase [Pseudobdellovibrionaceae bacterium]